MRRVTVNNETYNSPEQDYYWLDADTYFDIQDNIDLGGDTLYGVKESSIFAFHGGSLSNGLIYGVLNVEAGAYQIFQNNVDLNNSELMIKAPYILPEWFGAGTGTDDYAALKLAFDIAARFSQIVRLTGQYSLGNNAEPLVVDKNCTLLFAGGSLQNGILGGYINLKTESNGIFGNNLTFAEGTEMNVPYLRPEWFGAKGDYNPDTHTGTDDTAAISRAVRTAEILSIKTVKFNAVNYLVSGNGIMIYRGNIILEGSGAMLREEQMISVYQKEYNNNGDYVKTLNGSQTGIETKLTVPHEEVDNVYLNKNSAIYCQSEKTKGTEYDESDPILNRCITCYKGNEYYWRDRKNLEDKDGNQIGVIKEFLRYGVSDPIYIKDLQFICDVVPKDNTKSETTTKDSSDANNETKTLPEYLSDDKRCIGIDYQATYSGPTWPVIIERCYFKGFAVAFFLNSEYSYCIHCLTFRDNAFAQNIWCVYSNNYELTFQDDGGPAIQCSWSFEFVDNRCHQNDFIIKMSVHKGLCLIENNNTEGTWGLTNKNKNDGDTMEDTPDEYAIDIQLAQRAIARICHNHFEGDRTRLIKVVGYYGAVNRAIVTESNTDGTYETLNKCYFANVTLETDMNAIIKDCIIENKLPCEKTLTLEDITELSVDGKKLFNFAFLRHQGNKLIENVPFKLVDKSAHGGTVMRVTTPYGQRWMSCFYRSTTQDDVPGGILMDKDVYMEQDSNEMRQYRYLNIEIPFYKEANVAKFSYLTIILSEVGTNQETTKDDKKDVRYEYTFNSIISDRAGFYWMRQQINLDNRFLSSLHVTVYAFPAGSVYPFDMTLYYGAATFALSSVPLDLNMPLNPHDFDLEPLKNNPVGFFRKEDHFVSGVFKITCLQTGLLTTEDKMTATFYHYKENGLLQTNMIICEPKLLGTIWICPNHSFEIIGLISKDAVNQEGIVGKGKEYKYFKYYIQNILFPDKTTTWNGSEIGQCTKPVLLGKGIGLTTQMRANIVSHLCPGSSFFDTSTNKSYVLNSEHTWIEIYSF